MAILSPYNLGVVCYDILIATYPDYYIYFIRGGHQTLKVTLTEGEKDSKKRILNLWTSPVLDPNPSLGWGLNLNHSENSNRHYQNNDIFLSNNFLKSQIFINLNILWYLRFFKILLI